MWKWLRTHALALPNLAKFALGMAVIFGVPPLARRLFFGNFFFIPIFFVVTGFLIDPPAFGKSIINDFALAARIILALVVGKGIAAGIASRRFHYNPATRMTMWALTLLQVAATLAAALVGFDTVNPAGQRLVDDKMLNVVFVLMLTTSILGPVLTERFTPMMLAPQSGREHRLA